MHLNLIQLAETFGVSERTVKGWVEREGLPAITDRTRLVFDRSQVAQWAAARGLATQVGFLADTAPSANLRLADLIQRGGLWRDVEPDRLHALLGEVLKRLPGLSAPAWKLLTSRLAAPGGLTLAPIGCGWALPHPAARVALGRDAGLAALVLLARPLEAREETPDGQPVRRLLFFVAPSARLHLDCLARLTRVVGAGILDTDADDAALLEAVRGFDAAAGPGAGAVGGNP